MELKDCANPLLIDLKIGTDSRSFSRGPTGSFSWWQAPKHEIGNRIELLRANVPTMVEQGRAINQVAPTARILVVTQPCNTNCLIAQSHARDVPVEHWFALTQIPALRAVSMIAEKAGRPVPQFSRLTVWGNNSQAAYVDLRNAWIGDKPALEVIDDMNWVNGVMEPAVAMRENEVLRMRGSTPAGAVAQAIMGTIRSLTTPTPFERWFSAGVISGGIYGVPRGLVFGFPLMTADGRTWSIVDGLYLDELACQRIAANVAELEHEAAVVSHLVRPL